VEIVVIGCVCSFCGLQINFLERKNKMIVVMSENID